MPKVKITEKKLGREHAVGLCYQGEGEIEIDPRQSPKEYLNTVLHELLHHYFEDLTEKQVEHTSTGLTDALWKLGYRKVILK